jgi:hypothetical protein
MFAVLYPLTPGSGQVCTAQRNTSRFNGFYFDGKPSKRFLDKLSSCTGLKSGVNEKIF